MEAVHCLFSSLIFEVVYKDDIIKVGLVVIETESDEGPAWHGLEIRQL